MVPVENRLKSTLDVDGTPVYGICPRSTRHELKLSCACSSLTAQWDFEGQTADLYKDGYLLLTKEVVGEKSVTFENLVKGKYLVRIIGACVASKSCAIPTAPEGCLESTVESLVAKPEGSGHAATVSWNVGPFCGYRAELTLGGDVISTSDIEETHTRFEGLTPGNKYCATVRGVCSPESFGLPNSVCFDVPNPSCPDAEIDLSLSGDSSGSLLAQWRRGPYVGFDVVLLHGDDVLKQLSGVDATAYLFGPLASGHYCVRVTGLCSTGVGSTTERCIGIVVSTSCPAPISVRIARSSSTMIDSSWDSSPFAFYDVDLRRGGPTGEVVRRIESTADTSITFRGVGDGAYCVGVQGICASGELGQVAFACLSANCALVAQGTILALSCTDVTFSFDATGVVVYSLTPGDSPDDSGSISGNVPVKVGGLEPITPYALTFWSLCEDGSVGPMQRLEFTTPRCEAMCPPCEDIVIDLRVVDKGEAYITVAWKARLPDELKECILKYEIDITDPSGAVSTREVLPPEEQLKLEGLLPLAAYYICVRLFCETGKSKDYCLTETTEPEECVNKTLVVSVEVTEEDAEHFAALFTWDSNPVYDHYEGVIVDDAGKIWDNHFSGAGNHWEVTGLDKATVYHATIRAFCQDGSSTATDVDVYFCQYFAGNATASDNTEVEPGEHGIAVEWCAMYDGVCVDDTPGLTGWECKLKDSQNKYKEIVTLDAIARAYFFHRVKAGEDYTVIIVALCEDDHEGRPIIVPVRTESCPPVTGLRIAGGVPPQLVEADRFTFWWDCSDTAHTEGFECTLTCDSPSWDLVTYVAVVQETKNAVTFTKSQFPAPPIAPGPAGAPPTPSVFTFCVRAQCDGGFSERTCISFEYTDCGQRCLSPPGTPYNQALTLELLWDAESNPAYPPILKWSWTDESFQPTSRTEWGINVYRRVNDLGKWCHSREILVKSATAHQGYPLWPNYFFMGRPGDPPGSYIVMVELANSDVDVWPSVCHTSKGPGPLHSVCDSERGCLSLTVPDLCSMGLWCDRDNPHATSSQPSAPGEPAVFPWPSRASYQEPSWPWPLPTQPSYGESMDCPPSCVPDDRKNCLSDVQFGC